MELRQFDAPSDARAIIRINALAWREAYDGIVPDEILEGMPVDPTDEQVEAAYDGMESDREGILLAADDSATVRGYVYLRWGSDTKEFVGDGEAGLKEIYVEPEYWGEGIGTRLLQAGIDLLPESIERVRLEMLDGNEVGREFYLSRGFEITGTSEFSIAEESYPTTIYTLEL